MIKGKINICFPFVGDSIGGSHLSTIEVIKNLNKAIFDITVVVHKKGILYEYLKKKGLNPNILKINNYVGKTKGFLINFLYIIKNVFKLTPYINKKEIDVVHLNDSSAGLSWIIPTKLSKAKLIWHQRVVFPKWKLYKALSIFSDKIICISNFVYNSLPDLIKNKSVKIMNPVSIKATKSKNIKNKKEMRILFLANIIKSKRVDLFIETAKEISKSYENAKFYIVGSDKKKILKKNKFHNKKNNITYMGYAPNNKIWFNKCNLLLVTSENEGFNRTIVEGMLSQIPVLTVDSGAHKEIIKNNFNGWITKNKNPKVLSDMCIRILELNQAKLSKVLNRAKNFAKRNYSAKRQVNKLSKIYLDIAR